MEDCLFCKIVNKEVASDVVLENDDFLVFEDIHPKASVHILIVPKKHIASVDHIEDGDELVLGKMFYTAKETAEKLGVSGAYRLQVNVGKDGGQEIEHIHMHLLSEKIRKGVEEA
jgi:histidine triad (HIT) family protein